MAEVFLTDTTYWQSPLWFCGLFDFFALHVYLANDVSATEELNVNYD